MKRPELDRLHSEIECKHCHAKALFRADDQVLCRACGAWQFQLAEARLSAAPVIDALIRTLARSFEIPA